MRHQHTLAALTLTIGLLAGCGGGGGGGGAPAPAAPTGTTTVQTPAASGSNGWVRGQFAASSTFRQSCASALDQKNWLRSWTDELYLWYDEVNDQDPAPFTVPNYFDVLKTNALTPSGNPKDKFHFSLPTDEWQKLSQSGVSAGYGATWAILQASAPRRIVVSYTEPNTSATTAENNLARGAEVLTIDGVDVVNGSTQQDVDIINGGLFPSAAGESHNFEIRDLGATTSRSITLTSAEITSVPVQNVQVLNTATGDVGYILFNDHIATSEQQLIDAITTLRDQSINDLVLDIRYNGGGFLDIASELAFMISGPNATAGKSFEQKQFSDKHPTTDPVTGEALNANPFRTNAVGFSAAAGQPLPFLGLSRVFVITGPGTCSASEAVINGLRGIDVEVIQIGSTTCGKPYGFYPFDNCGTTYFSIQFRGINDKGFGDFSDGFSPNNLTTAEGVPLPGCAVADDFTKALGDPAESRLAAALNFRDTGACPTPSSRALRQAENPLSASDGIVVKSPWHTNRIYQ